MLLPRYTLSIFRWYKEDNMNITYYGGVGCWYACTTDECHGTECEDCRHERKISDDDYYETFVYNLRINDNTYEGQPI